MNGKFLLINSQGYRHFSELVVKTFLAVRPYAEEICATARMMMGTGLGCFKNGEGTIDRLRDRFKLELNEREAAEYMTSIIANAKFSNRSIVYDEFQRLQNGIPYRR